MSKPKLSNFVQSPFGHRTYTGVWHLFIINAYGADMKKTMIIVSAALAGVVLLSGGAGAQGTSQTVEVAKVDVQTLPGGFRASKVIGSSVLNDANETIGKIDDVLISPDGKAPFAVLSIGGFLGMDSHLVVVPYDSLNLVDNKIVLRGGTKDTLKMLPEFKYAAK
jgi:sporulation protein YlmC with PRC-barrel domain